MSIVLALLLPYLSAPGAAVAIVTAMLTGLFGYAAANRTARATEKAAALKEKKEHPEDPLESAGLALRFKSLMDGYEARIRDLTDEVMSLRDEVRGLRGVLDARSRVCAGCPKFQEWSNAQPRA